MKNTHGEGVLFVALLAALAACADPASRTVGLGVPHNAQSEPTPSSTTEERATLSANSPLPVSSLPVSFAPCCVHFPSERVNTHAAPM